MFQKEIGNTGVSVGEIGFGTARYRAGNEPIRRAVDLGATLIDTAEMYGTENMVGQAISGIRDKVFLATKAHPSNFGERDLIAAAERSLTKLSTDYIDLYQLHWPNSRVPIAETMGAMEDLVDAGKIRFIGVSNFSVKQLAEAQSVMTRHPIVSNQVGYSLIDRRVEAELLDYCEQNDITVIGYSPFAEGVDRIVSRDKEHVLSDVSGGLGKTEAQVALNWCVSHINVIAIPKASTIDHVEQNCGASSWRLSEHQMNALQLGIRPYGGFDYAKMAVEDVISVARRKARRLILGRR